MMSNYVNRSGTVPNSSVEPRLPAQRSGKVPEGPTAPLVVNVATKIVVQEGRLVVVPKETRPPAKS